jgi:hypothetical protein
MKTSRISTTAMALALVVAIAAPSTATAAGLLGQGGGNGGGQGVGKGLGRGGNAGLGRSTQKQDARRAGLQQRIERMLARRKAMFGRVEARLTKRIERLTLIADSAAAKGIDVSAAKAALGKASEQLSIAAAEELKAQDLFTAVLDAADKRAAFATARAQAKVAQKALQRARLEVVNALRILRAAIDAAGTTTP